MENTFPDATWTCFEYDGNAYELLYDVNKRTLQTSVRTIAKNDVYFKEGEFHNVSKSEWQALLKLLHQEVLQQSYYRRIANR